ncbi:ras GTPase-activating-like protein IQGAP1 [Corythoichthys intestinalis]|uniref:ras GTPase-activating-like protein IQGAP1 n=1 Tax=Corythoichthys intestinalis TaxID=161448 RepID=UPI0025A61960|nr:ras GTPase-activating-like protein IQGAP1 [Corythoichthys intestinalis]XP_061811069.1 ras GTPase-activating-like protein IQGAP1 [Nerophis lumbriciformis]
MSTSEETDGLRPRYGSVLDGVERLTAEEMDERRQQNMAYEYLCHLEEAKRWMEACLDEELPPTTELEEGLRNGVYLAKLGNFFAPRTVSLKKIYDREQTRYKATGLHFRHTDNVIQWLNAMSEKGLPKIFYPETTDIYDRKNMPRCIYCIHALSLYLFKLGLAPQIQDLYGKVDFTEEEINNMKSELEKYGIQMPAFSKIGGILANELSVDEAALHAAVIAINEAIDQGVPEGTMAAMQNPNAMLVNLDPNSAQQYQNTLYQAKGAKVANSRKRQMENVAAERDIYDELLTQAEIQGNVNKVNVNKALSAAEQALLGGDADKLYEALKAMGIQNLLAQNKGWYLKQLQADRENKELASPGLALTKDELQAGVDVANDLAESYLKMLKAVERINFAIREGEAENTVKELMNPDAQLPEVYPSAANLYQRELASLHQQSPECSLSHSELLVAVEMLSSVVLINEAIDVGDRDTLWKQLSSSITGLGNVEPEYAQRYMDELIRLKAAAREEGCDYLTWNDIQACIDQVNMSVQEEHERIAAIGLINEALDEGDPMKTLAALQNPSAKLTDVDPFVAQHYHDKLLEARREKAHETQDPSAVLWLDEIQDAILKANQDTKDALLFSQSIHAINEAVDNGDAAQTVTALRNPGAGLYGVTSECAQTYQDDLAKAKEEKKKDGDNSSEWVQHWVKGGHNYYYNLNTKEGTWVEPEGFIPNHTQLNKEDIQSVVSGVTTAYNREQLWLANETLITKLQARCRGYLVRKGLKERMNFLKSQDPAVTKIQAHWKGYKQRKEFQERKKYLEDHSDDAVKIQSMVRMHQARKKYRDRLKYFKDHIKDVVKIQAFIRANKARDDYKTLINAENPPMAVLRKFVHLLDHSDQDFQEELELMRLREEVITNIRSNQQLENDLNLMDIKIGLLVKNKITLQEVVSHSKKLTKKNKGQLSDMMMMNKHRGGLKALSKEKRIKLEAYQNLFYLLQTNPTYLAKLIFQMPQNKSTKFMDSVIFTLYNYASNQREEYLLLKLFKTALQEEIKSKVDQMKEIVTGNPTVIKMVVSFHRGARGQNALRQILAPVVKEIMDDKTLNIKTDPVDIYKSWVNQMEMQTGEASKLPYDVTPEQAMSHEEVRNRLEASIKSMKAVTDKFLSAIIVSVDKIPYGMRFISKVLKDTLHEKFPDATEDELLKIVGNLLYYRYMNPAIVAPDAFDIIEMSAGGQLTTEQRRNLGSVAKMLQHAASNKMFLGDNAHLNPINEYLSNSYQKFRRYFLTACDVPSLEDKFNVDQYSDLVTVTKPVIYISIGEMINTHTLLLDHQDAIAPEHNDPIHELLEDLGEVPTVEALIGENPLQPGDPNKELMGKTEVSLTLTNKFDVPGEANSEVDAKTLLLNTKRLIVDVIRFQPGDTLTEILDTTASPNQEAEYQRAMQRRAIRDAKTPEKIKQVKPVVDDSLTLQGKKEKIRTNLQRLAELGKVNPENRYQDLINDIAKDIRNQRRYRQRRKAELVKLQQTNTALNSKTKFYNVQIDSYNQYIKTCMDNLACKGKLSKPGANKAKKSKQVSQKYTASRLHEKGVLISIEDLQPNQFKNVIFEISPAETVGVFEVKAKLMGVHLETLQLEYQDLLQLQYEGVAVMKLFDRATINVNLLIFLLNKKFYGK